MSTQFISKKLFLVYIYSTILSFASDILYSNDLEETFEQAFKRCPEGIYAICSSENIQHKTDQEIESNIKNLKNSLISANQNIGGFKALLPSLEKFEENIKLSILNDIHEDIKLIVHQNENRSNQRYGNQTLSLEFQPYIKDFYPSESHNYYNAQLSLSLLKKKRPAWINLDTIKQFPVQMGKLVKEKKITKQWDQKFKSEIQEFREKIGALTRLQSLKATIEDNEIIIEKLKQYQDPRHPLWSVNKLVHTYVFLEWFNEKHFNPKRISKLTSGYTWRGDTDFSKFDMLDITYIPNFEKQWDSLFDIAFEKIRRTLYNWKNYDNLIQECKTEDDQSESVSNKKQKTK